MFCFQCEQTTVCKGQAGICGKSAAVAGLQDRLTGALITLAKVANRHKAMAEAGDIIMRGLFTTLTNVSFDGPSIQKQIDEAHTVRARIYAEAAGCEDYDMSKLWNEEPDIRSLKTLVLLGVRGAAAYAWHAAALGSVDEEIIAFFPQALETVGKEELTLEELLPVVMETGKINLRCMEILDAAHTENFGHPIPVTVPLTIEKGPFIVISGHDLHDLKLLLEQTAGKGVKVYTHGEMLPAHAYPELKKYPQLKGNFGTAWQNQQKEFDNIPAPVLFTTNCLMPVKPGYGDRVYTTGAAAYPGLIHIEETNGKKDFSPLIIKALELGGYREDRHMTGINGGDRVMTGFAKNTVLSVADKVIEAVKAGAIKHFFLVGGCDGAKPGRNYYTELVKQSPGDTLILTLACGKFRFNDLDIGTIGGLPRIMDMGQCNDAYSAIQVALALANAFGCGVNDLPLTLVLSWYEQKAVAILLTLLYLGIKNIRLGPSIPAFLSPAILDYLVGNFNIKPVTTPEKDLEEIVCSEK
jgi:hydroxylamine reductase